MIDDGSAQQYTCTEVIHVVQVYVYGTCSSRVPGYSINVCMCAPILYIINTVVHMTKVQNKERESPRTATVPGTTGTSRI